jgi:putative ABC transport system permease protein
MSFIDSARAGSASGADVFSGPQRKVGLSLLVALTIALESLARNKARTGLAALGIIIGVSCVITMMALGNGTRIQMEEQIRSMGSNTLSVRPAQRRQGAVNLGRESGNSLRLEDFDAILEECSAVRLASPRVDDGLRVKGVATTPARKCSGSRAT